MTSPGGAAINSPPTCLQLWNRVTGASYHYPELGPRSVPSPEVLPVVSESPFPTQVQRLCFQRRERRRREAVLTNTAVKRTQPKLHGSPRSPSRFPLTVSMVLKLSFTTWWNCWRQRQGSIFQLCCALANKRI